MEGKMPNTMTYRAGRWDVEQTSIIAEEPVTLSINNEVWLTFMCTPSDLEALAIGFIYNENIIETMEDVASVRVCPGGDNIDIWLNRAVSKPKKRIRTSGCSGGETSIDESRFALGLTSPQNGDMLPPPVIMTMMNQLLKSQDLYQKLGGVHTSALCDGNGIILTAEDIGRHNTLDKLAGKILLERIKPAKRIILTTGRISSEMIQKAGRMGASMVISRTSPTSLSIRMAERLSITLIGYARHERFTIYAHPERILTPTSEERIISEAK